MLDSSVSDSILLAFRLGSSGFGVAIAYMPHLGRAVVVSVACCGGDGEGSFINDAPKLRAFDCPRSPGPIIKPGTCVALVVIRALGPQLPKPKIE